MTFMGEFGHLMADVPRFGVEVVPSVGSVCFTGHRPDRLGTGYVIEGERVVAYSELLKTEIVKLIDEGAREFISGGALGIDQIAFWTVNKLQADYPHIRNIVAIPFKQQYTAWHRNPRVVAWYHEMIKRADEVVYVDSLENTPWVNPRLPVGSYHASKMQLRNQYMVDNADTVIAVWNGSRGGTGNCVAYAQEENKRIIQLKPIVW